MPKKTIKTTVNKSAVTGRFVSESYVKRHPNQTFKQTVIKKVETKRKK